MKYLVHLELTLVKEVFISVSNSSAKSQGSACWVAGIEILKNPCFEGEKKAIDHTTMMHGTVIKKQFWVRISGEVCLDCMVPQEEMKAALHRENSMASEGNVYMIWNC